MTTDTSAERMRRLADLIRNKDLVIGTSQAADAIAALAAERDALRLSLAEARNAALDEAIEEIDDCYITPDNDHEEAHHDGVSAAREAVLALKTPTGDTE